MLTWGARYIGSFRQLNISLFQCIRMTLSLWPKVLCSTRLQAEVPSGVAMRL